MKKVVTVITRCQWTSCQLHRSELAIDQDNQLLLIFHEELIAWPGPKTMPVSGWKIDLGSYGQTSATVQKELARYPEHRINLIHTAAIRSTDSCRSRIPILGSGLKCAVKTAYGV